jgi:hypothetical protein
MLKRYAVHNTGDWVRNPKGYGDPIREPATVKGYDTLDTMHPFDRARFEWMLEHGEVVTSTCSTVYQIRAIESGSVSC